MLQSREKTTATTAVEHRHLQAALRQTPAAAAAGSPMTAATAAAAADAAAVDQAGGAARLGRRVPTGATCTCRATAAATATVTASHATLEAAAAVAAAAAAGAAAAMAAAAMVDDSRPVAEALGPAHFLGSARRQVNSVKLPNLGGPACMLHLDCKLSSAKRSGSIEADKKLSCISERYVQDSINLSRMLQRCTHAGARSKAPASPRWQPQHARRDADGERRELRPVATPTAADAAALRSPAADAAAAAQSPEAAHPAAAAAQPDTVSMNALNGAVAQSLAECDVRRRNIPPAIQPYRNGMPAQCAMQLAPNAAASFLRQDFLHQDCLIRPAVGAAQRGCAGWAVGPARRSAGGVGHRQPGGQARAQGPLLGAR